MAYLIMAGVMGVGVMTTLMIKEVSLPQQARTSLRYHAELLLLFFFCVIAFVSVFFFGGEVATVWKQTLGDYTGHPYVMNFLVEVLLLTTAILAAWIVSRVGLRAGISDPVMVDETYVAPVKEFFQRHGVKTSLLLLALIGSYRISDIVLGVISNVFYQDMTFTKDEIAWAVKNLWRHYGGLRWFSGGPAIHALWRNPDAAGWGNIVCRYEFAVHRPGISRAQP